ncbi:MAG: hypothetical protein IJB81_08685 [Clostridia bacterium]|nr:hypothetical protein [Clostridia bacterium]
MKRYVLCVLTLMMNLSLLPFAAFAQTQEAWQQAEMLQHATDVFEVTEDGQQMRIATVLDEGTEYVPIEKIVAQDGTAFDVYYFSDFPIEWIRILYRDRKGAVQQGWIVVNPDAITGINMHVFDDTSDEAYNGDALGIVLCESLSLREQPDAASTRLHTMTYGTCCTMTAEIGAWYKVSYCDEDHLHHSGWVRKEYVLVNPNYFIPDGETPVYALPSGNSKRVGLIYGETGYPIIGEMNGFFAISLRGASGFVAKP